MPPHNISKFNLPENRWFSTLNSALRHRPLKTFSFWPVVCIMLYNQLWKKLLLELADKKNVHLKCLLIKQKYAITSRLLQSAFSARMVFRHSYYYYFLVTKALWNDACTANSCVLLMNEWMNEWNVYFLFSKMILLWWESHLDDNTM